MSSTVVAGSLSFRNKPSREREIDDMPTCNILAHRSVLERQGGFSVDCWPRGDIYLSPKDFTRHWGFCGFLAGKAEGNNLGTLKS